MCAGNFDIERCNSEDLVKMHFMTYETVVENEVDQVLGVVHVGDFGSVGPKHVSMFNITGKSSIDLERFLIHNYVLLYSV